MTIPDKMLEEISSAVTQTEYGSLAIGVLQLVMLGGLWMLKLRKRLRSNEAKVETLERKMSRLQRVQVSEV